MRSGAPGDALPSFVLRPQVLRELYLIGLAPVTRLRVAQRAVGLLQRAPPGACPPDEIEWLLVCCHNAACSLALDSAGLAGPETAGDDVPPGDGSQQQRQPPQDLAAQYANLAAHVVCCRDGSSAALEAMYAEMPHMSRLLQVPLLQVTS